ncbi:hypothetical protein [Bacillus phage SPO1L1]|nr:hypothetical protein [Bacillus phage SPO1L1]WIT26005.1 hypothetical protein [Bacillus phage SPO1L2]
MDKDVLLVVMVDDLIKGKSDRSGLIQQVVTYVKDGRTVTRKQWVRSGFADHAKLANEQKKKKDEDDQKQVKQKEKKEKQMMENDEKLSHRIDLETKRGKKDTSDEGVKHGRNRKVLQDPNLKPKKKHKKKHKDKRDKKHNKEDK